MRDKLIFVSEQIYEELVVELSSQGDIVYVPSSQKSYWQINHHVDIHLLRVLNRLFIDHETFDKLRVTLQGLRDLQFDVSEDKIYWKNYEIHSINSHLADRYPLSVCFNAKYCNNLLIHNLVMTEPQIMTYVLENNIKTIHTKQGYTGCSLLLLNEAAGITSDRGLFQTLSEKAIDILLIQKGFIELKGFSYGFIGGASFVIGKTVYFNGDLSLHPDAKTMLDFLKKKGYEAVMVPKKPLKDIGSAIILD